MKKLIFTILCATSVLCFANTAFALSISPYDSATNLATELLGSGITISNVSYTGATGASGYFTDGDAAGIGMDEGIILTSGAASNADGVSNTSDGTSTENYLAGDSELNALLPPGDTSYDATVLEFDFMSVGDSAYFNYVFASEEYNEWVGGYNDVFGFFVDGVNYAVIPGTSTPVSVNTVNNGSYSMYYNDNDPSDTSTPYAFEYDGFTDVFTASITGLTANVTYHIKLAIADANDWSLDSAVFLEAGTFSDTPPEIPEPATMLLMGTGLLGLVAARRRKSKRDKL